MELSFASDTLNVTAPLQDGETLISKKQTFVLGFFSPGDSQYRFLGMWYKNIPQTIVWVANRNNPVKDRKGVLTFRNDGNIAILDVTKNVIWSSNVSRLLKKPVARLLDSGNFVLMSNDSTVPDNYLWQSFDYPSDTLLADMNLVWSLNASQERYLTSWKSLNDPSTGDFTLKLDSFHDSVTLVTYHGSEKSFRFGPFNGRTLGGYPTQGLTFKIIVKFDKNETYYTYQPYSSTQLVLLTLNQSGAVNRLIWTGTEWFVLYASELNVPCQNYSYCGSNNICRPSKAPNCECLGAFEPQSTKNLGTPSHVCKRRYPLDCERAKGDKFQTFLNMEPPDMLIVRIKKDINLTECEAMCLTNCSCSAFSTLDTGTGCSMWFGDIIDFKEMRSTYQGQDIHIRVPPLRSGLGADMEVPLFDFATISAATENFSEANVLGVGGFGMVYKVTVHI
ncbi:hypothetical protein ACFE04_023834 [Oxalis oulophora]